jgi:hypothetical protein
MMGRFIVLAFAIAALGLSPSLSLPLRPGTIVIAPFGESCSAIIAERNNTFDEHRQITAAIATDRREISAGKAKIELLETLGEPKQVAATKALVADLEEHLKVLQANEAGSADKLSTLDQKVAACRKESRGHTNPLDRWNGIWQDGPYTVRMGGGSGGGDTLGYTAERLDPLPPGCNNCVPLHDVGGGSCTVKGSSATCTWEMHYTDSAKDVERVGRGTLQFVPASRASDDTITYKFVEVRGTIKLTGGTCPDINQCTSMHPGAEWSGTWTRKKP